MDIRVDIEATRLIRRLDKGEKRVAFAVVNALNRTAERIQQAEFEHVRSAFIIRKPAFFFGVPGRPGGAAARLRRASVGKARPYAEVWAGASSQASARRTLLTGFERGAVRRPMTPGAKRVAVPLQGRPARPSIRRGVPPEFTFAGMQLRAYRGGRKLTRRTRSRRNAEIGVFGEFGRLRIPDAGSAIQWKGRNRTFLLPSTRRAPGGGVFQRIGPKRGDIREIWSFIDPPKLDTRLRFVATAELVAAKWFALELESEIKSVLAFQARRERLLDL